MENSPYTKHDHTLFRKSNIVKVISNKAFKKLYTKETESSYANPFVCMFKGQKAVLKEDRNLGVLIIYIGAEQATAIFNTAE